MDIQLGSIAGDTRHLIMEILIGGIAGDTDTADFIKKVLSVYTHATTTIYLSLSAQVAKSTFS